MGRCRYGIERRPRLREALRYGAHHPDDVIAGLRDPAAAFLQSRGELRFLMRQRPLAEHRRRHRPIRDLVEGIAAETGGSQPQRELAIGSGITSHQRVLLRQRQCRKPHEPSTCTHPGDRRVEVQP